MSSPPMKHSIPVQGDHGNEEEELPVLEPPELFPKEDDPPLP